SGKGSNQSMACGAHLRATPQDGTFGRARSGPMIQISSFRCTLNIWKIGVPKSSYTFNFHPDGDSSLLPDMKTSGSITIWRTRKKMVSLKRAKGDASIFLPGRSRLRGCREKIDASPFPFFLLDESASRGTVSQTGRIRYSS